MNRRLRDDCFLHDLADGGRISHAEAVRRLADAVVAVTGRDTVPVGGASGRVLADPLTARFPVPAHTNAAVDGYAFAASAYDQAGGSSFQVTGRAAAGHAMAATVLPGAAARILTGAVMPDGTDTVAMQEDCEIGGQDTTLMVRVPAGLKPGANVRRAGEDLAAGTLVFPAGHILRQQDLAALASIGSGDVRCVSRPRIAVVSTGDEVVRAPLAQEAHVSLASGQVFDANAPMLASLATAFGAGVTDLGIWPDRRGDVEARLAEAAKSFDAILTTGGASRGEEDHIAASLAALGHRNFWQINIKPGRPLMFGQVGDCIVAGLPGNPVAVFVCALLYIGPLLRSLGGAPWREPRRFPLPAAFAFTGRKQGRREFWRGILVDGPGGLAVDKFARDGSGLISGLRAADGLIDIAEDHGDVAVGDELAFIPFSELGISPR